MSRPPRWPRSRSRAAGRPDCRTCPSETAALELALLFLLFFAAKYHSSFHLVRSPSTLGAGSIAGLPLRKPVALGRSWLFLQPNNSQLVIAKSEIQGLLLRLSSPRSRSPQSAGPGFPKPKFSPVPRVLSGPDQAQLSRYVEEPQAGAANTDTSAIIRHAHGDNSRINRQPPTLTDFC
jgi:hypothetical protein